MPRRATTALDESGLSRVLTQQDGVVSRSQLIELGATRADVRRLLARRDLVPVHAGVYVDHSGKPTRRQREWAAVLACAPAALHRESALDAHGMTRDRSPTVRDRPIHVLVDRDRRVVPPPGVIVERVRDWSTWVQDNRRPPRAECDFAVVLEACRLAVLIGAVLQRRGWTGSPRPCGTGCIVVSGGEGPTWRPAAPLSVRRSAARSRVVAVTQTSRTEPLRTELERL